MARTLVLLAGGLLCLPLFGARAPAQPEPPAPGPAAASRPTFAPPVRIMAGEGFAGAGRLYPSPVCHDIDGDGLLDLLIGDLPGRLTGALRIPGAGPPRFGKEAPLLDAEGKPLKFDNW